MAIELTGNDFRIHEWMESEDKKTTLWLLDLVDVSSTDKTRLEQLKQQILDNQKIVGDVVNHIISQIQSGKKTTTMKRLQELVMGKDFEMRNV